MSECPTITHTIQICESCLGLEGEMCHVPECIFCRRTMKEVEQYLDVLLIRPLVDGNPIFDAPLISPALMSELTLRPDGTSASDDTGELS